jgi:methylmalonyl-CoA carboxyltransferase large subunit
MRIKRRKVSLAIVIDGHPVYVACQDFTVAWGSVGETTARKICEVMDQALKTGDPFIFYL